MTGMKVLPKLLYLLCFVGLAVAAALALDRSVHPSMSDILLRAVVAASLAGTPGLVHRKAWPLALVLLPLGAYLLIRTTLPLPNMVEGLGEQYSFYAEQLREGGAAYLERHLPSRDRRCGRACDFSGVLRVRRGRGGFPAGSQSAQGRPGDRVPVGAAGVQPHCRLRLPGDSWLAVLFMVLAACLLVLSRGIARSGWRLRDAAAGGLVGVVAALMAVVLLGAAPSTAAAPWQDWRTWDPFRQGGSVYSFNWMQNYPRLLDPANDQLIMHVQSATPSYWRANALDVFTGTAWVTSQAFVDRPQPLMDPGTGLWVYDLTSTEVSPPGKAVTETFQIQSVYTNYIFAGGEPSELRIDRQVALRLNDMRSLHVSRSLGPSLRYELDAVVPDLKPRDVIGKGRDYPRSVSSYLSLPFPHVAELEGPDKDAAWRRLAPTDPAPIGWEWADLYATNAQIVGDATDPYDVALRIEKRLRNRYEYSLTPPSSDYTSPYAAFLFDTRTGYCQHFAGVMALLLRYNDVPARVAVGFTTGEKDAGGDFLVSTSNAHAWVEVYFPTVGWVAFDPTPGRNIPAPGPSSSTPGFINPFNDTFGGSSSPVSTVPRPELARRPAGRHSAGGRDGLRRTVPAGLGFLCCSACSPWPSLGPRGARYGDAGTCTGVRSTAGWRPLCGCFGKNSPSTGCPPLHPPPSKTSRLSCRTKCGYRCPRTWWTAPRPSCLETGRATEADFDELEALRRHVTLKLRRHYGWMRTSLAWYGLSRAGSARGTVV